VSSKTDTNAATRSFATKSMSGMATAVSRASRGSGFLRSRAAALACDGRHRFCVVFASDIGDMLQTSLAVSTLTLDL